MAWPDHFAKGTLSFLFICLADGCFAGGLATSFCQRLVYVSFHLSPTSLLCSTAWPDHVAKGLLSCLFFCFPDEFFAGWLGQVILPHVCFHFFAHVSQMIALPDGLARSCCQRFLSILFIGVPQVFALRWMACQIISPKICFCVFSHVSHFGAFARFLFMRVADDCFAGLLARSLHSFLLIWLSDACSAACLGSSPRDDCCAGCLGVIYFLRVFLPLSSLWDWSFHVFGLPDICLRADSTTGRRLLVSKVHSDS